MDLSFDFALYHPPYLKQLMVMTMEFDVLADGMLVTRTPTELVLIRSTVMMKTLSAHILMAQFLKTRIKKTLKIRILKVQMGRILM